MTNVQDKISHSWYFYQDVSKQRESNYLWPNKHGELEQTSGATALPVISPDQGPRQNTPSKRNKAQLKILISTLISIINIQDTQALCYSEIYCSKYKTKPQ